MPALFLLAHHDDEVFCAAHLARELRLGGVRLLWATAGGLAPARRRLAEGHAVRRLLGLDDDAARDLSLGDTRAVDHLDVIVREASRMATDAQGAAQVKAADASDGDAGTVRLYVSAFEGGSPDHDAVNVAAALVARRVAGVQALEFPMYRREGLWIAAAKPPRSAGPEPHIGSPPAWASQTLPLNGEALDLRRRLVAANHSQEYVSLRPLLALARWAGRGRVETTRPLPAYDYTRPPAPRPLLYELYTRRRFAEWRDAAEALAGLA